jgi:hypothetical protein
VVLDNVLLADYFRGWKADPAVLGVGRRHQAEHRLLSLYQPDGFRGQSGLWHHGRKRRGGPGRPLHPEHRGPPRGRPTNASTRWAVIIGEDGFPKLQWQALPLPAFVLNGKAIFKRYILA